MVARPTPSHREALHDLLDRTMSLAEQIIAELDALDGDPDLEPSLGAPESPCMLFRPHVFQGGRSIAQRRPGDQRVWAEGGDVDEREETCEDEGGACEDEGVDSDSEPNQAGKRATYDEGGANQLVIVNAYGFGGRTPISTSGV